jgi:hypothetical protein
MIVDYLKEDSYQKGQIPLGVVAVDSSFVEAKKGRKCRVEWIQKKKRNKDSCSCNRGRSSIKHPY